MASNTTISAPTDSDLDARKKFLIHMYDQLFNHINTHILVVWQSIGVLISAFAAFALVEKGLLPLDLASALIVLISAWLICHVYDSSFWYNRNLVIVANIERQFLKQEDLHLIHYYFGKHRKNTAMLSHLQIQFALAIGVTLVVLWWQFSTSVKSIQNLFTNLLSTMALPYWILVASIIVIVWLRYRYLQEYKELLNNSPGIPIDTKGIEYGVGHPPSS